MKPCKEPLLKSKVYKKERMTNEIWDWLDERWKHNNKVQRSIEGNPLENNEKWYGEK